MLPYPSGKLHMGHVRNYTINDVMVRQMRMRGYNTLMPMGWDAFGMPAENAAIISKISPAKWTKDNIAYMKKQMISLGLSIDWSREICTCDPQYYKWNQWMFLKMLEKGIAYRKKQVVNWDPIDQTVLANEQVIDGRGWRSGSFVEKREIPGYYLRITNYANELLDSIKELSDWPDRVISMQKNWIGKSEGFRFFFRHNILDSNNYPIQNGQLYVFTTRPDTIMGVTFCAISTEHQLASHAASKSLEIKSFINKYKIDNNIESELTEKAGIPTGFKVIHPITGKSIDVWICNYVKNNYGEGAIMGVPGHDEADFKFAKKYHLPIVQVVHFTGLVYDCNFWQKWYKNTNYSYTVNSGKFNNLEFKSAFNEITNVLKEKQIGDIHTTWRLHDWSISRQRYWGTPIPIIHCKDCGIVPVPEKDLPVILPNHLIPDGNGNPLTKHEDFLNCFCPKCKKSARRETDTMDTFFDSSWYFMRYSSPKNDQAMIDYLKNDYWMPIDHYIGGIEHAVLHLLYARFWTKVMRDLGLVNINEPFKKLLCQGMVLNHTYSKKTIQGGLKYFNANQVDNIYNNKREITGAYLKSDKSIVRYNGITTMSKSKSNGVDPQFFIDTFGADTVRLFIMFANSPEKNIEWSESGINGANRFLHRVWSLCYKNRDSVYQGINTKIDWSLAPINIKEFRRNVYLLLKQANYDYQRVQYNTIISTSMKLTNIIEEIEENISSENFYSCAVKTESIGILLRILYPITPHITWKLWNDMKYCSVFGDLINAPWPEVNEFALVNDKSKLIIQINGKFRDYLLISNDTSKEEIEILVIKNVKIQRFLSGRLPKRIIIVPNKLVNIVV
ncbi:MAG: leucine--tRNA ligase [Bordetella sp.]|nr:MAG: leucine--tRNA ligase [Bordetella sp.]